MNVFDRWYKQHLLMVTMTQLQVLVTVLDTGSFTKAVQTLNMTQPAVSHAILNLETDRDQKRLESNEHWRTCDIPY
ncbi:helix-turn-helix domain-containing protein [Lysinibacillus sp. CTST325]